MVTCTTPPFRAAVRLNSGVSPQMKLFALLALLIALPVSAENLRPVAKQNGFCALADESAICYEWQVLIDPSIRFVAEGYEDGIDYGFYRLDKTNKYTHIVSVYPVIRDPSRKDALFWGYPWDIYDIELASVKKPLALLFSIDHALADDGEISIPKWQKHVPAVLFIGRTTQPRMTVPNLRFKDGTLNTIRSAVGANNSFKPRPLRGSAAW